MPGDDYYELRGIPIRDYTGDDLPDARFEAAARILDRMRADTVRRALVAVDVELPQSRQAAS
jgi:hypothetical protein